MEVLLWVLKTETQGPLQIRPDKIFSKKCWASDQQETQDISIGIHKQVWLLELLKSEISSNSLFESFKE
jgi:hypothetical protein